MRVHNHKNMLPIKMWCDDIDPQAMQQLYNLAQLPFAFKWIAAMPDCHSGYGMPIGGVLAADGVVVPNAVGVDIGCGMCAVKTTLQAEDVATEVNRWQRVQSDIRQRIPMGQNHCPSMVPADALPSVPENCYVVAEEFDSARYQLGTLGGGNHFIEIQKGSDGYIWLMLHSGSRNVGYRVANHYAHLAQGLNERWKSQVPPSMQLAFLPLSTEEGHRYLDEMKWCVQFAQANRDYMMNVVRTAVEEEFAGVLFAEPINIAHNYAAIENHYSKNVIVHRKGATRARKGEIGIIPGSMGTHSYIVKGLGNTESFCSCSHGAGRLMSRTAAKERLDLNEEKAKLERQGVIHSIRGRSDLDEAPGAYKDIESVMSQQADLVKPLVELSPILVLKG